MNNQPRILRIIDGWPVGESRRQTDVIPRVQAVMGIPDYDFAMAGARLSELVYVGLLAQSHDENRNISYTRTAKQWEPPSNTPQPTPTQVTEWVPTHNVMRNVELPDGTVIRVPIEVPEQTRIRT